MRLGLVVGRIGRGSLDEEAISGVPATETYALGRLRWKHGDGETRVTAGRRKSFDGYSPLEILHEQELTRRLSFTAALGLRQPAPESAALRVAGMKDQLTLGAQYHVSRYDRIGAQWSRRNFDAQNGTRLGQGGEWELEYAHAIRTELRDFGASVFWSRFSFDARADLIGTPGFAPYTVLLPPAARAFALADPASLSAEDRQELDAAIRGLLPTAFQLYGIRLSTNTRLQRDYTRAWRPFASIALTHNSTSGAGYGALLGMAGSVVGNDHFQIGWQIDKGGSANFNRTREFGLSYRLFF